MKTTKPLLLALEASGVLEPMITAECDNCGIRWSEPARKNTSKRRKRCGSCRKEAT